MQIPRIIQALKPKQPSSLKTVAATVIVGEPAVVYGTDKFIHSKNK